MPTQTEEQIHHFLKDVAYRMWKAKFVTLAANAVAAAATGWLVLSLIRNVHPYPHTAWAIALSGIIAIWLAVKAVVEFQILKDPMVAARQVDRRAGLHNRISTAIEFEDSDNKKVASLVVQDAVESLHGIRAQDVVSMPSVRRASLSVVALCFSSGVLLMSPFIVPVVAAEQRPLNSVIAQGNQDALLAILQQILDSLKQAAENNPSPELEALIHSTEETLAKLQDGQLTTSDGYLELSELQQQMLDASSQSGLKDQNATWQKIADALQSSEATDSIGQLLQSKQFEQAKDQIQQLDASALSKEKLTPAEITSLTEKLDAAAEAEQDAELANVLKDLSAAIKDGNSEMAMQQMQDLAAESAKYQIELEQAEHLDELADQIAMGKQQLAIKSNSSGDGQMGGQGLNEETGRSESKGGADSQKAGAKTAGNIDGPKADLEGQRKLAELQGQFGEEGQVEVKTKSTDERPDFEITRQAQAVHSEYSRQLEADLQRQEVPAGHQDIVRKYFEAIRPKADGRK